MKRALLITGTPLWSMGGKRGASSFYNTVKGYIDNGWSIDVISCNSLEGLDLERVRVVGRCPQLFSRLHGIAKVGILFRFFDWFVFQFYVMVRAGVRLWRDDYSVVYAYEIAGVPASMAVGRLFKKFVVTRFQGTVMVKLQGQFAWRLRYWDHWMALRSKADLVIMANDGTQGDLVLRSLGVPDSKVRFWMNGVRLDALCDNKQIDKVDLEGKFVMLAVSRLVAWKRVDRIISRMPEIRDKINGVLLIVVGDGDAAESYKELARKSGCGDCVKFIGSIPHTDVSYYMKRADVFLSMYDLSNVGNPLLEAMASSLCVIALNNGDTASVIENGVSGILINPDDLDRLPDVVFDLYKKPEMRYKIGMCAKSYAEANFLDWPARMRVEVDELEKKLSCF